MARNSCMKEGKPTPKTNPPQENKFRKLEKAQLWLSEIPCWKSFPANVDAAGTFILHRFSGSTKCYPCQGLGIFRQGNGCWQKSAPPSGTLLDFLLWDRHSLLEFSWFSVGPLICPQMFFAGSCYGSTGPVLLCGQKLSTSSFCIYIYML